MRLINGLPRYLTARIDNTEEERAEEKGRAFVSANNEREQQEKANNDLYLRIWAF